MDLEKTLKKQFVASIKKTFIERCPLIGDKWFIFYPKGKPADFKFTGVPKLAKATSINPSSVAKFIVKNLSLKGIGADVEITEKHDILVHLKEKSKPKTKGKAK